MSWIAIIGFAALAVLAVGWVVVSFSAASRRRTVVEWVAATALYVFLLTIFVRGLLWARGADSIAGLIGFGFLCVFFGAGIIVCATNAFRARGSDDEPSARATN